MSFVIPFWTFVSGKLYPPRPKSSGKALYAEPFPKFYLNNLYRAMTTFSVVLHNDIYDKLALMEARRAYADYAKVRTERVSPNVQKLTISVENRTDEEAREIILSFLNFSLDSSLELFLKKHEL